MELDGRFSFKTFSIGLLLAVLFYAAFGGYAYINQHKTLEALENRLASQTVIIDGQAPTAPVQTAEAEIEAEAETEDTSEAEPLIEGQDTVEPPAPSDEEVVSADIKDELADALPQAPASLVQAPVEGLYEKSELGLLPVIKNRAETPFTVYKKPYILNKAAPFISVAVRDFGLSQPISDVMIEALPSDVSFIMSPYTAAPQIWIDKAREDGHEVWLEMPVENLDFPFSDPGAKGLLTHVSLQYNQDRLDWILSRVAGYTGVAAYTDDALSNAGPTFKKIANDIFERGLGYFELNTDSSFFIPLAATVNAPHVQADIDVSTFSLAASKLGGKRVIVMDATQKNIKDLKAWIIAMENRGVQNAPLSATVQTDGLE